MTLQPPPKRMLSLRSGASRVSFEWKSLLNKDRSSP
jgi:hypothetical protein